MSMAGLRDMWDSDDSRMQLLLLCLGGLIALVAMVALGRALSMCPEPPYLIFLALIVFAALIVRRASASIVDGEVLHKLRETKDTEDANTLHGVVLERLNGIRRDYMFVYILATVLYLLTFKSNVYVDEESSFRPDSVVGAIAGKYLGYIRETRIGPEIRYDGGVYEVAHYVLDYLPLAVTFVAWGVAHANWRRKSVELFGVWFAIRRSRGSGNSDCMD